MIGRCEWLLSLSDFACLYGFNRNPHTFYLTARKLDANTLNIWAEFPPCVLYKRSTDTTTFLSETFTDDTTTFGWAFTCDCANS